jgi:hypothetical protein
MERERRGRMPPKKHLPAPTPGFKEKVMREAV